MLDCKIRIWSEIKSIKILSRNQKLSFYLIKLKIITIKLLWALLFAKCIWFIAMLQNYEEINERKSINFRNLTVYVLMLIDQWNAYKKLIYLYIYIYLHLNKQSYINKYNFQYKNYGNKYIYI